MCVSVSATDGEGDRPCERVLVYAPRLCLRFRVLGSSESHKWLNERVNAILFRSIGQYGSGN